MSLQDKSGLSALSEINKYLAKLNCPKPKMWLAMVNSSCGCFVLVYGVYLSLPTANNKGWTPAASTALTSCSPGISSGIALPLISWIKAPNWVSSCGGRPTTVKGQIASFLWYTLRTFNTGNSWVKL